MAKKLAGKLRTLQGGGCSMCYASDENVGKRRCKHVLDNAAMAVRKDKGMYFVDISGEMNNQNVKVSAKQSEEKIASFAAECTSKLSNLTTKEKKEILNVLRTRY